MLGEMGVQKFKTKVRVRVSVNPNPHPHPNPNPNPNPNSNPDPNPDPHPNPHPHPHPNQLTIDGGEPFYEVDSSFGWFIPEVFEKQIGLDNGKTTPAWHLLPKNAGPQPQVYALP